VNELDTPFTVDVGAAGATVTLTIAGRVDRDAESSLLDAFTDAVGDDTHRVVLDFGATSYINSSGLAAIVALLTDARGRAVTVAVRGLTDHYRHLFAITRLTDLVELEPPAGAAST
jgi:anti-sigma B factor antagonist